MNKSHQLQIQELRARINVRELLKKHDVAWNGQEPKLVKDVKKPEGVEDAPISRLR